MKDLSEKTGRFLRYSVGIGASLNAWISALIAEDRRAYCQIGILSMDLITSMYVMKET